MQEKLWAKKKEKDYIYYWLPLKQHLLDTANIMGQLWNHWLSEGQKELIISMLSSKNEDTGLSIVRFLGAIHDIGKSTPVFQTKNSFNGQSHELDKELIERLVISGFAGLSEISLANGESSPHAIAGEVILYTYGVGDDIGSIIGGHHGKPVDSKTIIKNQIKEYTSNYFQSDFDEKIKNKWQSVQKDIFEWALIKSGFKKVNELPTIEQPAMILLEGMLIMADWIASNEDFFPLFLLNEDEEVCDQKERLKYGWSRWSKSPTWELMRHSNVEEGYQKRFDFFPREFQSRFSKTIEESINPGIFILEAPMGMGKTEAALFAVEQLSQKRKCSGMFFGLPTQASSDGIFKRIEEWVKKLASDDSETKSLQLVHGKSQFNEEYNLLKKATNIDTDGGEKETVVANEWFVGRKTAILDELVVGTIDQFLSVALKHKHLALRHLGLSKKVIILDEIHAYDAYMGQFLYQAIKWMGAYDVPVVILSATLPATRRRELICSYFSGKMVDKAQTDKSEAPDWDKTNHYPIITYTDGLKIKQVSRFNLDSDITIKIEYLEDGQLIQMIKEQLSDGGIAGIIVNTVKRAQDFARQVCELFDESIVMILHSSFLSPHRHEKEKQLLNEIGKDAERPFKKIIIGTQILEQSLDIDFDVLFTDFAPIDLLLQRVGRVHRHAITKRPEKLIKPQVYILGVEGYYEFNSGASKIYGDYLLMRTYYYVPTKLKLPSDISRLVQLVYADEDIIFRESNLHSKYYKAKEKHENVIRQKEEKAKIYRLDSPYEPNEDSLIKWLTNEQQNLGEESGFATVRDCSDSIEVILIKKYNGSLMLLDDKTKINEELTDKIAQKIAQQTIRLPNIFSYKITETIDVLEKLNVNELLNWQEQPWLKGCLGIILDKDNNYNLCGLTLHYDEKYGLTYKGGNDGEQI